VLNCQDNYTRWQDKCRQTIVENLPHSINIYGALSTFFSLWLCGLHLQNLFGNVQVEAARRSENGQLFFPFLKRKQGTILSANTEKLKVVTKPLSRVDKIRKSLNVITVKVVARCIGFFFLKSSRQIK